MRFNGRREGLTLLSPQLGFYLLAPALVLGSRSCLGFCSFPAFFLICAPFGFCLLAPALFLGALPGFGFRLLAVLLFLGSPLGLSLQPPCFLLSLLLGFDLVHSPALFRRGPWLIQCFDDLLTEALDLLSDGGRLNIEMT